MVRWRRRRRQLSPGDLRPARRGAAQDPEIAAADPHAMLLNLVAEVDEPRRRAADLSGQPRNPPPPRARGARPESPSPSPGRNHRARSLAWRVPSRTTWCRNRRRRPDAAAGKHRGRRALARPEPAIDVVGTLGSAYRLVDDLQHGFALSQPLSAFAIVAALRAARRRGPAYARRRQRHRGRPGGTRDRCSWRNSSPRAAKPWRR